MLACALQSGAFAQQPPAVPPQPPGNPVFPPPTTPGFGEQTTPGLGTAAPAADLDLSKPPPFYIQTSVTSTLSWSNDGTFGTAGTPRDVTTLDITPSIVVHGEGAHYRLNGTFSVDGIESNDPAISDRFLPRGNLDFNAELVQNLLYFDAGLRSTRTTGDPFGVTTLGPVTGVNEYTTNQYRIAPYILREITPDITFAARSENTWSSTDEPLALDPATGYYGLQSVRLDRRAEPLGWGVDLTSATSRFEDQGADALKNDAARFSVSYAFDSFLVGLIGGYERADLSGTGTTHGIGGVRVEWRPDTRTALTATVEDRYFGTGWNVSLGQRNEDYGVSASLLRDVTTYPAVLSGQVGSGFVTSLLDSMLSSQYTNSTQRAAQVQNLLSSTGIPADLAGVSLVASAQALLVETASLNAILLGKFNTLSFTVYHTRTVPYFLPGEEQFFTVPVSYIDNAISGATVNWVHHLNATWDTNTTLLQANTTGLGEAEGTSTKQTSIVAQLADRVSPRTTVFAGVRYQLLKTSLTATTHESAVFAGFTHRF